MRGRRENKSEVDRYNKEANKVKVRENNVEDKNIDIHMFIEEEKD